MKAKVRSWINGWRELRRFSISRMPVRWSSSTNLNWTYSQRKSGYLRLKDICVPCLRELRHLILLMISILKSEIPVSERKWIISWCRWAINWRVETRWRFWRAINRNLKGSGWILWWQRKPGRISTPPLRSIGKNRSGPVSRSSRLLWKNWIYRLPPSHWRKYWPITTWPIRTICMSSSLKISLRKEILKKCSRRKRKINL